jgi:membrane protein
MARVVTQVPGLAPAVAGGGVAVSSAEAQGDQQRIRRLLTFWLRPAFVLRVLTRFQRMVGFDRAIALASSALTALIPIAILAGSVLSRGDANRVADHIISRYGLTGAGADALREVLSPTGGTGTDISVAGVFLLVFAALSFSRGAQRMFEQAWDLKPLSVRNTINDLTWIAGLVAYFAFSWWIHSLLDRSRVQIVANAVMLPASVVFLAWGGRVLSAKRISWRQLAPFGIVASILVAICLTCGAVYLPHLFSSYASRYGVIGAVLAMISALFILMVVIVACAAVGREVSDELDRIERGERPPDDEIRQEWNAMIEEARLRTQTLRDRVHRWRHRHDATEPPP